MLSAIGRSLYDLIAKHNVVGGDMGVPKFYTFYGSQKPEVPGPQLKPFARLMKVIHDIETIFKDPFQPVAVTSCLMGILFGSIHCFGWNFEFPSDGERILWKVCSLAISGVPLIWLLSIVLNYWLQKYRIDVRFPYLIWFYLCIAVGLFGPPVYILARLGLVTEAFIALRAVPEGAYEDVHWTLLLPHIQI